MEIEKTHAKTGLIAWACKACVHVQDLTVPTLNPRFAAPTADPSQVQMRFFFRYPLVNLARIFTFVPGRHMHWSDHPHKESRRV